MSYFHFPDNQCIFDVTPVENLFIEEYMRMAPGDFVKVYLYGLMHCYYSRLKVDIQSFSRALSLDERTVENALKYWERRGLIKRDKEGLAFLNVKSVVDLDKASGEVLYKYKDYNKNIQDIFEGRALMPDEFQTAIDWLEVYNFEPAAAIYMLVYCVEKKYNKQGKRISFSQLEKTASEWAEKGILTLDAAEDYVEQEEIRRSGVRKVLKHLGITRMPTSDESALFSKWTTTMGFSSEAVLEACNDLTRTNNPNLALLDKILKDYKSEGKMTSRQIADSRDHNESMREEISKIMYHLGVRMAMTPALMEKYSSWRQQGFSVEAIVSICDFLAKHNESGFPQLEAALVRLKNSGKISAKDVFEKNLLLDRLQEKLNYIFQKAGTQVTLSVTDLLWFEDALSSGRVTADDILSAARLADGAKNKTAYIKRILQQDNTQERRSEAYAKVVDFAKIPSHDYAHVRPDSLD